jgi:glycosyltransferase involved in cell wall biosynthesis
MDSGMEVWRCAGVEAPAFMLPGVHPFKTYATALHARSSPVSDLSLSILTGLLALIHLGLWSILLANVAYLRRGSSASSADLPRLTVCIPARNEAKNLRRLLSSLLKQDYASVEFIVWDDGSEDDTWEILQSVEDPRLQIHRGDGPPDGWVGKVHALYQCTRRASGDCYLFLDADAELTDTSALRRLVQQHTAAPTTVSSGFTRLRGGAKLLVSLVPYAILTGLPWPLVARTSLPSLSALNGQCWCIDAEVYHAFEPHAEKKNAVLEDVAIGRYLKKMGHPPTFLDVQSSVKIYMYESLREAWRGFRKNAYLLMGGTVLSFFGTFSYFALTWIVSPFLSIWFLASLYGLKFVCDRASDFSVTISLLAPVSFVLGLALQIDSALHHWTDRVIWKGRTVPASGD